MRTSESGSVGLLDWHLARTARAQFHGSQHCINGSTSSHMTGQLPPYTEQGLDNETSWKFSDYNWSLINYTDATRSVLLEVFY
jgi:hypothetical protein